MTTGAATAYAFRETIGTPATEPPTPQSSELRRAALAFVCDPERDDDAIEEARKKGEIPGARVAVIRVGQKRVRVTNDDHRQAIDWAVWWHRRRLMTIALEAFAIGIATDAAPYAEVTGTPLAPIAMSRSSRIVAAFFLEAAGFHWFPSEHGDVALRSDQRKRAPCTCGNPVRPPCDEIELRRLRHAFEPVATALTLDVEDMLAVARADEMKRCLRCERNSRTMPEDLHPHLRARFQLVRSQSRVTAKLPMSILRAFDSGCGDAGLTDSDAGAIFRKRSDAVRKRRVPKRRSGSGT